MAVTPNYGWPVPVATDYVKDGWEAISDLGNAIDTTVAGLGTGLTLVKSQVIGTTVASVTVTNAFNSTFDNYLILLNNTVGSTNLSLNMTLGASATGYYLAGARVAFSSGTVVGVVSNNAASWGTVADGSTTGLAGEIYLSNPNLATRTAIRIARFGIGQGESALSSGYHNVATAYTDFTLTCSSGTITGGTIYVYGYQK